MGKPEKPKIREIIVVEGKDDTASVRRAVDAETVETHGFGLPDEIWPALERAARERGLIILTDPDRAGENIRRVITERFPDAKQAYLPKAEALRRGDIGVENAAPEAICSALAKAHAAAAGEPGYRFTERDLYRAGLLGRPESRRKREKAADILGLGRVNGKTMLRRLNAFGVTKEEFDGAVRSTDDPDDQT